MTPFRYILLIALLAITLTNCKKEDGNNPAPTEATQTDLLVANNWQVNRVTTPAGEEIKQSRLNLATQVLYLLKMQFRNNGTVRALDPGQSNSVVNGGTWTLTPDNQSMDVDVSGFKGNFPIIELTKTKLILRQRAPVDGKDADINLEFQATL